ncbi:hypothetical protein ACIRPE_28475, partial [Kitasatospora aureofaciens]
LCADRGAITRTRPTRTEVRAAAFTLGLGIASERRHSTDSGLEVEVGIGSPAWAKTDPVDPGTRRVVTDGARVLHDPAGILAGLLAAC